MTGTPAGAGHPVGWIDLQRARLLTAGVSQPPGLQRPTHVTVRTGPGRAIRSSAFFDSWPTSADGRVDLGAVVVRHRRTRGGESQWIRCPNRVCLHAAGAVCLQPVAQRCFDAWVRLKIWSKMRPPGVATTHAVPAFFCVVGAGVAAGAGAAAGPSGAGPSGAGWPNRLTAACLLTPSDCPMVCQLSPPARASATAARWRGPSAAASRWRAASRWTALGAAAMAATSAGNAGCLSSTLVVTRWTVRG
jgi:hypothetical protein